MFIQIAPIWKCTIRCHAVFPMGYPICLCSSPRYSTAEPCWAKSRLAASRMAKNKKAKENVLLPSGKDSDKTTVGLSLVTSQKSKLWSLWMDSGYDIYNSKKSSSNYLRFCDDFWHFWTSFSWVKPSSLSLSHLRQVTFQRPLECYSHCTWAAEAAGHERHGALGQLCTCPWCINSVLISDMYCLVIGWLVILILFSDIILHKTVQATNRHPLWTRNFCGSVPHLLVPTPNGWKDNVPHFMAMMLAAWSKRKTAAEVRTVWHRNLTYDRWKIPINHVLVGNSSMYYLLTFKHLRLFVEVPSTVTISYVGLLEINVATHSCGLENCW